MNKPDPDSKQALVGDNALSDEDGEIWILLKDTNSEDEMKPGMDHLEPQAGGPDNDKSVDETEIEQQTHLHDHENGCSEYTEWSSDDDNDHEDIGNTIFKDLLNDEVTWCRCDEEREKSEKLLEDYQIETDESGGEEQYTDVAEEKQVPEEKAESRRKFQLYNSSIYGIILIVIIGILAGSKRDIQQTQQIRVLIAENGMLRVALGNYMNIYSQIDLENQVQQANRNFEEMMAKVEKDAQAMLDDDPDLDVTEPLRVALVPHVDGCTKEEKNTLVLDEAFVLPSFCSDKMAFKDVTYNDFVNRHCDINRRKIDATLHRFNYLLKHIKIEEETNYEEYMQLIKEKFTENMEQALVTSPLGCLADDEAHNTDSENVNTVDNSWWAILKYVAHCIIITVLIIIDIVFIVVVLGFILRRYEERKYLSQLPPLGTFRFSNGHLECI